MGYTDRAGYEASVMVVQLDLRVPGKHIKLKLESEKKLSHYFVFSAAAAFMLTVVAVLLLSAWKFYSLNGEKNDFISEKNTAEQNLAIMEKEFSRLSSEAGAIDAKLDYMLGDVPSVEIMTALDPIIPNGVAVKTLTITNDRALFGGAALNAEDVMVFINKLSAAAFVQSVGVPNIKNSQTKNQSACTFSVECKLKPLREILATDPFPETKNTAVSGDEGL